MKQSYELGIDAFGYSERLAITEEDYQKAEQAKRIIAAGLEVECKYESLVLNYYDFESALSNNTIDSMLHDNIWNNNMFMQIINLNRLISNFLSTARAYRDQTKHIVSKALGREALTEINKYFEDEENSQEYKFMEIIRNVSQHSGQAISYIGNKRYLDQDKGFVVFATEISIETKYLYEDSHLVKEDLIPKGKDRINIIPYFRKYAECLSLIHSKVRKLLDRYIIKADATIKELAKRYNNQFPVKNDIDLRMLRAYSYDKDLNYGDEYVAINSRSKDLYDMLKKRNHTWTKFSKSYASGLVRE